MRFAMLVLAVAGWLLPAHGDAPPGGGAKVVLVVHGGAGVLTDKEMAREGLKREQLERGLARALTAGYAALQRPESTPVDAVEAAIRVLEDDALFNAGRGAVLTHDGRAELDASIMDGRTTRRPGEKGEGKRDPRKRAGAVAGVWHVKNPISAARAVMEMPGSRHVLLTGAGAEDVVLAADVMKRYRIEKVSNTYFWTDRRVREIRQAVAAERSEKAARGPVRRDQRFGTVGAVACKSGAVAAGTSTGGLTNKLPGRVGDSPLIGAGTYADDRACGVSCTGTGEVFIRHAVAHDVVARMLYKRLPVDRAVRETIDELPDEDEGVGGLIALDRDGRPAFGIAPRGLGMYRGYVTEKGELFVAVFKEPFRRVKVAE
ncbi:MAG: isoaspartyl peptidase/L-asparaginase [Gemmataceae bacterium]